MAEVQKQAGPVPGRRIAAAVWDAAGAVRASAEAARAEAAAVLAGAERARDAALAEAAARGEAAGRGRAAAALAAAAAARDRLLADAEREIGELAIAVARAILGRELALDPGAICALVAQAVRAARERRAVLVRVNPADAPALRAATPRLALLLRRADGLELREDPRVAVGDAILETEAGRIEAGVEAQLAEFLRALEEEGP